ncbi:DUF3387 domain-containing protein [Demequina sp. TMPB413]|nr:MULTISPECIES: type I restriction enzyme endonuclease domain-containing protein [unclassified Demequina]UPU89764.1 DUF3387 domain-containing protein [Demequina sp. TMPB413]
MPGRNLALEVLERLLLDEVKVRGKWNVLLARRFSQLLEAPTIKYRNRAIESAMVIHELVDLALERCDRLDAAGKCAGADARDGEAGPEEVRVPARSRGGYGGYCFGTG